MKSGVRSQESGVRKRKALSLMTILLSSALAAAQPGQVFPSAEVRPTSIRLSDSVALTLSLEGPAPLRMEPIRESAKLLTAESAAAWHIRPLGPAAITRLSDGRERWSQTFRLDPYLAGEAVPIGFAPVRVMVGTDLNAHEVTWSTQEVRVRTSLAEARAENARPVTGIEQLPPIAPPPPETIGWPFVAVLASVFAAVVSIVLVRRSRATPPPPSPGEWARRELAQRQRVLRQCGGLRRRLRPHAQGLGQTLALGLGQLHGDGHGVFEK